MKIGYARVSTPEQKLELQEDILNAYGIEKIFTDKTSGAKDNRPGLENLLKFCRKGDIVIVWKLDRLARSLKDLTYIINTLHEKDVHLLSLTESIDTSTATGKLTFHIFASIAEFELGLIRERTKAGLESARARGRRGGRKFKLDDKQKEKLKLLIKDPNFSPKELQEMFGVSKATLYRYAQK